MDDDTNLAERLRDLEIHVAHQDQTIEDLSEVVHKQWDEIKGLRHSLERQVALLQQMEGGSHDAPPADQRPPHY